MRAIVATRPGPPEVLSVIDLPDPDPAPDQVVVAVEVIATTFIDTQLRGGRGVRPLEPGAFPIVLGNGVGGTVSAIGAGVESAWMGVRVVTSTGGSRGYASRAVAAVSDLHRVPETVGLASAVAVLADGRTALGLTRAARIRPGETVAVTAAAGGVGSLAVQLARDAGARVVALAGDARKLGLARGLGAESAINYRDDDWADHLDTTLDVVFDGVGGSISAPLVARLGPGGRYLPHGAASGAWGDISADDLTARGVTVVPLSDIASDPTEQHELVEEALRRVADGTLVPSIGQTFPLDRAVDAHAAIEARETLGKTLLIP